MNRSKIELLVDLHSAKTQAIFSALMIGYATRNQTTKKAFLIMFGFYGFLAIYLINISNNASGLITLGFVCIITAIAFVFDILFRLLNIKREYEAYTLGIAHNRRGFK